MLMDGYNKIQETKRTFEIGEQMLRNGISPNHFFFSVLIRACAINKDLQTATRLMKIMEEEHFILPDVVVYGSFLQVCAAAGDVFSALKAYRQMNQRGLDGNKVIFSILINVYAEATTRKNVLRNLKACLSIANAFRKKGILPNVTTYTTFIKLCARGGKVKAAFVFLEKIKQLNLPMSPMPYSTLLHACATAKDIKTARKVWKTMDDERIEKDVIAYCTMLSVLVETLEEENQHDRFRECCELIQTMRKSGIRPNARIYNVLIHLFSKRKDMTGAAKILGEMRRHRIRMDHIGYTTLLNGYSNDKNLSSIDKFIASMAILEDMKRSGIAPGVSTFAVLMNLCLSIEDLKSAEKCFALMKDFGVEANAICYGALIKCREKLEMTTNQNAYLLKCLEAFLKMKSIGIAPDEECYTTMISACGNVCEIDLARYMWKEARKNHKADGIQIFGAMIKALLNVEKVNEAYILFREMLRLGKKPNEITYHLFLRHFATQRMKEDGKRMLRIMFENGQELTPKLLRDLRRLGIDPKVQ